MIYRVLTTVQVEGNKDYADRFEKLVEAPPLTEERVLELCREKRPVIGNLINGCTDYHPLIALERLDALKTTKTDPWVRVTHLNGLSGLGVGYKLSGLDIFQEQHPSCPKEYPLRDAKSLKDEKGLFYWIEIPKEFLQETHNFLTSAYMKRKFKCLKE